ncbi:Transposase [Methanosarcina siciliae C2J]|uniref:Transposase n=2 Tax=Methanosarcina siciliae TaxID=38027 RepID=A0A0E3PK48_9EURY|nr:Transposase [Methanosarcina siciliae C2J]
MIWGEIGEVENFKHPDQLAAFSGFDPKVKKSGQKEVISGPNKRGSRVLRCLIGRAVVDSRRVNPVIGEYFDKKISEGKHYKSLSQKPFLIPYWEVPMTIFPISNSIVPFKTRFKEVVFEFWDQLQYCKMCSS